MADIFNYSSFFLQAWINGQLVNQTQMNLFNNNSDILLGQYFIEQPCIMNGLTYIQTGTSNTLTFADGSVRFEDQPNVNSPTVNQFTAAPITGSAITITCPISSTQYYIVAQLTQTVVDDFTISNTGAILTTAYTLAEIAAMPNPLAYIPLYTITTTDSVTYTIGTDNNCAFNYGQVLENAVDAIIAGDGIYVNQPTGRVVISADVSPTTLNNYSFSASLINLAVHNSAAFFNYDVSIQAPIVINPYGAGHPRAVYLGSNNTGAGGYNGLVFDDTAPRPVLNNLAVGSNTAQLLSFADFPGTISTSGQQTLSSGLIIQWGIGTCNTTSSAISILTFPTAIFNIMAVCQSGSGPSTNWVTSTAISNLSTIIVNLNNATTLPQNVYYLVIGY